MEALLVALVGDVPRIIGNIAHGMQVELFMDLGQLRGPVLARRIANLAMGFAGAKDGGVFGHLRPFVPVDRRGSRCSR